MTAATETWADPVEISQYAGGSFGATLFTVWKITPPRRRIGSTLVQAEAAAMVAEAEVQP